MHFIKTFLENINYFFNVYIVFQKLKDLLFGEICDGIMKVIQLSIYVRGWSMCPPTLRAYNIFFLWVRESILELIRVSFEPASSARSLLCG